MSCHSFLSFELWDALERSNVPYAFYDRDSAEGAATRRMVELQMRLP